MKKRLWMMTLLFLALGTATVPGRVGASSKSPKQNSVAPELKVWEENLTRLLGGMKRLTSVYGVSGVSGVSGRRAVVGDDLKFFGDLFEQLKIKNLENQVSYGTLRTRLVNHSTNLIKTIREGIGQKAGANADQIERIKELIRELERKKCEVTGNCSKSELETWKAENQKKTEEAKKKREDKLQKRQKEDEEKYAQIEKKEDENMRNKKAEELKEIAQEHIKAITWPEDQLMIIVKTYKKSLEDGADLNLSEVKIKLKARVSGLKKDIELFEQKNEDRKKPNEEKKEDRKKPNEEKKEDRKKPNEEKKEDRKKPNEEKKEEGKEPNEEKKEEGKEPNEEKKEEGKNGEFDYFKYARQNIGFLGTLIHIVDDRIEMEGEISQRLDKEKKNNIMKQWARYRSVKSLERKKEDAREEEERKKEEEEKKKKNLNLLSSPKRQVSPVPSLISCHMSSSFQQDLTTEISNSVSSKGMMSTPMGSSSASASGHSPNSYVPLHTDNRKPTKNDPHGSGYGHDSNSGKELSGKGADGGGHSGGLPTKLERAMAANRFYWRTIVVVTLSAFLSNRYAKQLVDFFASEGLETDSTGE
ncbi:MAG: hypothetical protein LBU15_01775 [Rickettsiales bacterium]|nr:hypothetical protein [Rickettsiales bacterium]